MSKITSQAVEHSNSQSELGTAPIGRLLMKLAIPSVIAQLVNLLYNVVDRVYIGHMPENGNIALTGIGLCFPIIYLVSAFSMLIGQGGAPRAAISMGKKDNETAERILGNCFTSLIAAAFMLTAVFEFFGEDLLWLFGASENTMPYALPYLQIYVGGSLFIMLSMGLNLFITTQGFSRFSMITVLLGAICNIILDPIFIYGFKLGVQGAALATVISQAVSSIWVVLFLFGKRTQLRIRLRNLMPERRIMLPVLALGLAPFVMQATEALINIAFNSSLQKYGGDTAVGAMTIASTIMQMIWLPSNGIGQGAQPIMSYNFGARNPERVKKTFSIMLKASLVYLVTFWLLVEIFPQFFIRLFNSDEALLDTSTWALRVYIGSMLMMAFQMSIQQTFLSIGNAKSALFIACMRKIILLIPLIYLLPLFIEDKVFAVFLSEPVADFLSATIAIIVFRITFPKAMKSIAREPASEAHQAGS